MITIHYRKGTFLASKRREITTKWRSFCFSFSSCTHLSNLLDIPICFKWRVIAEAWTLSYSENIWSVVRGSASTNTFNCCCQLFDCLGAIFKASVLRSNHFILVLHRTLVHDPKLWIWASLRPKLKEIVRKSGFDISNWKPNFSQKKKVALNF